MKVANKSALRVRLFDMVAVIVSRGRSDRYFWHHMIANRGYTGTI